MSAIHISQSNFQEEVMNSSQKILLDFRAPWCASCRTLDPLVESIAKEREDIKVGKINIDEEGELMDHFAIKSIPTLIVMENGTVLHRVSGVMPKKKILSLLSV